MKSTQFKLIAVGSGRSGGCAAESFVKQGGKICCWKERLVQHFIEIIPSADEIGKPVVIRWNVYKEDTRHFPLNDTHPLYVKEKPFYWVRYYSYLLSFSSLFYRFAVSIKGCPKS